MNLYSPGLGHSHVSPCPSVLRSQEMCQADSGGSDLGCGLGAILLSSASFPCPPQGWPEGSAPPGPAVSLLCLGRKPAAVWWLTLALALGGEVRLGLLTRRPGVFCIFCSVSTVCTHGAKALCQMDSRVHLTLGWSLLQRGASAGTLVPENLFPRVWKATGLWEHLMIERDQHHVCTFSIPPPAPPDNLN